MDNRKEQLRKLIWAMCKERDEAYDRYLSESEQIFNRYKLKIDELYRGYDFNPEIICE